MKGRGVKQVARLIDVPFEVLGNHLSPYLSLREMYMLAQVNRAFYENLSCQIYLYWQSLKINESPSALTILTYQDLARIMRASSHWRAILADPAKLLDICLDLTPGNLFKLARALCVYREDPVHPLKDLALTLQRAREAGRDENFYKAFICYALFTTDIKLLDLSDLQHTLDWLNNLNNPYATKFTHALTIIQKAGLSPLTSQDILSTDHYLNLSGAYLFGCQLEDVDFSYIRLVGANLAGSRILRCKFIGADLEKVVMANCKLSGSDFSLANWKKAYLSLAAFGDANVLGGDFDGVRFLDYALTRYQKPKALNVTLNRLDELLRHHPMFTELHQAVKKEIVQCIEEIDNVFEKRERLVLFNEHPLFIMFDQLKQEVNNSVGASAELEIQNERELVDLLTYHYNKNHRSPEFGEARRKMALLLVEALNKVEHDRREQLLKAAYHHPFFGEHRHLPSVREIFNKAFDRMRWYALNCFGLYANQPLHRSLIETNSQKLLSRELMVPRG